MASSNWVSGRPKQGGCLPRLNPNQDKLGLETSTRIDECRFFGASGSSPCAERVAVGRTPSRPCIRRLCIAANMDRCARDLWRWTGVRNAGYAVRAAPPIPPRNVCLSRSRMPWFAPCRPVFGPYHCTFRDQSSRRIQFLVTPLFSPRVVRDQAKVRRHPCCL